MNRPMVVTAAEAIHYSDPLPIPDALARELRRADDFIKLAAICARSAYDQLSEEPVGPTEVGLFIGTGPGPLQISFEFLDSLVDDGEGQASPTLFSHSVHNAAAGYVSRLLSLRGPALTLTSFAWPFLTALAQARLFLLSGQIRRAVVLAVETDCRLLADARTQISEEERAWPGGAVTWILEAGDRQDYPHLLEVRISERNCRPEALLTRSQEHWQGDGLLTPEGRHPPDPLAFAFAMTEAIRALRPARCRDILWRFNAEFGKALLVLEKK